MSRRLAKLLSEAQSIFDRKILLLLLGLLSSCGVHIGPSSPSDVNGNWLLVGNQSRGQYPVLSTTLTVNGNEITGISSIHFLCSDKSEFGLILNVAGQIAPDGTFQFNSLHPNSLQIMGSIPRNGEATWTGNYKWDDGSQGPNSCTAQRNGNFIAAPITSLSGTYTGVISGSGSIAYARVTAQVSQGTTLSQLSYPLNGVVAVEGSSCFKQGTTAGNTVSSFLEGMFYNVVYNMDDGSQMYVSGWIYDPKETTLEARFLVKGGTCDRATGSGTLHLQ